MTIEVEKAFDSLDWQYLFEALKSFNFGPTFIQWIQIFFRDITSCNINNNVTSDYFHLSGGVRQGDPLSPLLFVLAVETLAINICSNHDIHGLFFAKKEIKVLSYADDTTAVLATIDDAKILINLLNEFEKVSGLKINEEKIEAIWLGNAKQSTSKPLGIKWPGVLKVLGIYVSYDTDKSIQKNLNEKIKKMKQKLTMWQRRNLTIAGKILILKTFGLSQMLYFSSVLSVPEWALKEVNKTMYEFLWNEKHNKMLLFKI